MAVSNIYNTLLLICNSTNTFFLYTNTIGNIIYVVHLLI